MKNIFTFKKCSVDEKTKERTETKLSKLDKFFKDDCESQITFSERKNNSFVVEITVEYKGVTFRSEQTSTDFNSAVDLAVDSLIRQIRKNKTKLEKKIKGSKFDFWEPAPNEPDVFDEDYTLIRTKRFVMKPMSLDEAILQMNMIGHEFFVFCNSASHLINVVYRRKDGNYSLIEPDVE